jgi:hypothetical protein
VTSVLRRDFANLYFFITVESTSSNSSSMCCQFKKKYFWSLECNTSCKAGMPGVPNLLVSHSGNCLFKTSLLLPPIIIIITMVVYWALLLETKYIIQNNTINSMFHILFFLFIHKLLSFFLLLPRDKFFNITFSFFIHDLFYFKWNVLDA